MSPWIIVFDVVTHKFNILIMIVGFFDLRCNPFPLQTAIQNPRFYLKTKTKT